LALLTGIFAFTLPLFGPGLHFLLLSLVTTIWMVTGLYAGVLCWREGYQPARFFVLAFSLLFLGVLATIIPNFGFPPVFKNSYLATLISQTFDILLLSLALADRINMFRTEKQTALEQLVTSEQHKAEIEREAKVVLAQANEKLQQSLKNSELESERKSNFLRMVSHELRTPLHSISSSIDQWGEVRSGEQQDEIFKDINYGAVRLCTQVDNLVLMAETDDDKLEAEIHPFELRPVIDKLHRSISSLIDSERVSLQYRCAPNLPRAFCGDAYLISHLLRTVLDNACKYTSRGEILFAVDWNDETQMLGVTIKDDGCGMSKEQQKVVFQGFVQVSRGLTRQSEGLGLGLTLCHRLSEVLNANLSITSELGEGSQIDFQIPLEPLSAEEILPRSSDYKGSILIVEDNLVNAKVLERMVVKLGHSVNVAHSGLEALAAVGKQRYSVILMDIQMPDMDGITATQKIREQGISSPIIAVTANSDADVRRNCRLAGMNDIIIKPVKLKDIQQLLLEWQQVTTPAAGQAIH
jgi:signal transduction histidine kinase/ActR/RegA family two-component response regulator